MGPLAYGNWIGTRMGMEKGDITPYLVSGLKDGTWKRVILRIFDIIPNEKAF